MKKKILAALFAGVLCVSAAASVSAAETAAISAEAEEKDEVKLLGEDAEGAFHVLLRNNTGKDIKEVKINVAGKVEYKDAENILAENDVFAADEERLLCYLPVKEEETEAKDTKEEKEPEIPVYNIQFTFADDTTAEIHTFPFGDLEEGELKLEGEIAYLIFDCISLKESVNTLETETKIANEIKAAKEAAAASAVQSYDYSEEDAYDYNYDYDYDYDYDESGDTGSDDGGDDSCLTGGILN